MIKIKPPWWFVLEDRRKSIWQFLLMKKSEARISKY